MHLLQITMRLAVFRLVFFAAIFVGMNSVLAQAPASIPPFTLKKFESEETVSLDQFYDAVVVLDFLTFFGWFRVAYGCQPNCKQVVTKMQ